MIFLILGVFIHYGGVSTGGKLSIGRVKELSVYSTVIKPPTKPSSTALKSNVTTLMSNATVLTSNATALASYSLQLRDSGLMDLGKTCYMHFFLQCLLAYEHLRSTLVNMDEAYCTNDVHGVLILELVKLMRRMTKNKKGTSVPPQLKGCFL